MAKLTDKDIKALPPPASGYALTWDSEVKGFGVRITASGARAFVLNYRTTTGQSRRLTIGNSPDWSVSQARERAKELKRRVDDGGDPSAERQAERAAPTVAELAERFEREHLPRRRATTAADYKRLLRVHILPRIGKIKVADLTHADVDRMHREIVKAGAPYRANRAVAVLSKMLNLTIKWGLRSDNPARGVEREPEESRQRYLTPAEIVCLGEALDKHKQRTSCNALKLLLLTGARRGETLTATWSQFDLNAGVWTKPSAATKQGRMHSVPLSDAAVKLLTDIKGKADPQCPYVFPGPDGHALANIKLTWLAVCRMAGLAVSVEKRANGKAMIGKDGKPAMEWKATARIHDLRHTYASILASNGLSLPIIGALLGHTQAATTHIYAHLAQDPLRAATQSAAAFIANAGKPSAEIVPIKRIG